MLHSYSYRYASYESYVAVYGRCPAAFRSKRLLDGFEKLREERTAAWRAMPPERKSQRESKAQKLLGGEEQGSNSKQDIIEKIIVEMTIIIILILIYNIYI